jgi:hypothetical protein
MEVKMKRIFVIASILVLILSSLTLWAEKPESAEKKQFPSGV